MSKDNILKKMEEYVAKRDMEGLAEAMDGWEKLPAPAAEVLATLARGVERARQGFADKDLALPELLLCLDCFKEGVERVGRLAPGATRAAGPVVVIGVAAGDVHHMGKNIVAAVLSANGYRVHDAGRDVPNREFLELVKQKKADVLALSVMMSTPQQNMAELISMLRLVSPETAVIVGGASMDETLARALGADGYAENAVTAPEEFSRVMAEIKPKSNPAHIPDSCPP